MPLNCHVVSLKMAESKQDISTSSTNDLQKLHLNDITDFIIYPEKHSFSYYDWDEEKEMIRNAIIDNDEETAKRLINESTWFNNVTYRHYNGETLLYTAVSYNRESIVKLLLIEGANPNISDYAGIKPIQVAFSNNNGKLIRMLVKYGSDPVLVD